MDSCCFIDLAKEKVGKAPADRKDDLWFLRAFLDASAAGDVELFTSTLTVAECTHAEGDVSEEVRKLFRGILTSGQYIRLVQPEVFISEDARDLKWVHGIPLRGADAIHVASALAMGCKEFVTTDTRRKGPLGQAAKIAKLGLRVIHASDTRLLPDKYRQPYLPTLTAPAVAARPKGKKGKKR